MSDRTVTEFSGASDAATATAASGQARNLTVSVSSGDALDVRRFRAVSRMSDLFEVTVVAVSDNHDIDFEAVVGQPMTFTANAGQGRAWTGICNDLQQIAVEERGLSTYQLSLVPTLWLLTQRRNHRMFQHLSEIDIVQKLLGDWGLSPTLKLTGTYKKRKYRVQYNETDYDFMRRMLEDVGVAFYFDDDGNVVLDDGPQGNAPRAPIAFRDHPTVADREHVTAVRFGRRLRPGKVTLRDHDYRRPPDYKLLGSAGGGGGVEAQLEVFEYVPGAFNFESDKGDPTPSADDKGKYRTDEGEGAAMAQRRLDGQRAGAKTVSFDTNVVDPGPGMVLSFLDHPKSDLAAGNPLLVTESIFSGTHSGEWTHTCTAVSGDAPYRPEIRTPRPRVSGVESATVVGPAGEEIHVDEFGRVRVHFHWDRESGMNENSSCWIHVSQPWGGTGFGGTNLPRIGQEVLVDFLGGDPDRPIIVGRVYTNLQKTPYKLPDDKTQSGWKSRSSPGGGAENYNEIMFEDQKGKELVRMQAEKDLHKLVKNDEEVVIGRDRTKLVKHDDKLTVDNDRRKHVRRDEDIAIGHDRTKLVENDEKVTIGNDREKLIRHDERVKIGNNRVKVVENDENVTIGNDLTRQIRSSEFTTIGRDLFETVMANVREVTGMSRNVVVGLHRATQVGMIDSNMVGQMHSVMISPPGETWEFKALTRQTMTENKIELGTAGGATFTLDNKAITLDADKNASEDTKTIITMANQNITLNTGATTTLDKKSITLKADGGATTTATITINENSIELKVGESKIQITENGINIDGKNNPVSITGKPINLNCDP